MEVLLDFGGFRVLGLCFSVLGAKGMVHRIFFSMGVVFELPPVVSAFFFLGNQGFGCFQFKEQNN